MNQNDIQLLTNDALPEAIRAAIATSLLDAESAARKHDIELQRLELERRKFFWSTPFVAALAGLLTLTATFVFDRLTTQTDAEIAARDDERLFQYEIVRNELADRERTNTQRAAVLLFLTRAGVLSTLNESELRKMAQEQKDNPSADIVPRLLPSSAGGVLSPYTIALHYLETDQGLKSEAEALREMLSANGIPGDKIVIRGLPQSWFDQTGGLSSDQIRYEAASELDAAVSLQSLLQTIYPARTFSLQTIRGRTPNYISIFLK